MPDSLKTPNYFQDIKEFMRQTKLYHEIYGNEYIYSLFPVGFTWNNSKALFSLPPNLITKEYNNTQPFWIWPQEPQGITYTYELDGVKYSIDNSQILHMNDNNVTVKEANGTNVLNGESKLKGLRSALKNIKMAYESRGVILKYRGALGILSNQSTDGVGAGLPLEEKEIKDIQEKYNQYGGLEGQFQAIITSANLRWQQMSVDPNKLGLFQETEEDFNKILDAFGVPSEMFTRQKGATFENQNQARKSIYENTIVPEANEWCMGLNTKFFPEGCRIIYCEDLILDWIDFPYADKELPFVEDKDIETFDEFWGRPFIVNIEQFYRMNNSIWSGIARNHGVMNAPKYVYPEGSVYKQSLNNEFGSIAYRGPQAPQVLQHNYVNRGELELSTMISNRAGKLGRLYDISRGNVPQGVTAAQAMRLLEDQQYQAMAVTSENRKQRVLDIYRMVVKRMAQYYKPDDGRMSRILGPNNSYLMKSFKKFNGKWYRI